MTPASSSKRKGSLLRTCWCLWVPILGVFFLRFIMDPQQSASSVIQTIVIQEQMHQEQVNMIQDFIQNNVNPEALALQLVKTSDMHDFTRIATAIAQREGPPFSDMDFSKLAPFCHKKKRCNCGIHKCFHGSVDHKLGYLVAGGSQRFSKMMTAFQREEFLINKYGIMRMSVSVPFVVENVTEPMLEVLRLYGHRHSSPIVVQQVIKAPEPNLFVGAGDHKSERTRQRIPQFAAELASAGKTSLQLFSQHFSEEVERLSKVVSDPNNLYLRHDWQAIIDVSGTIFYIDLDRGLENLQDYAKLRPNRIKEGMESIGKWLTTGMATNFSGLEDDDIFVYVSDER